MAIRAELLAVAVVLAAATAARGQQAVGTATLDYDAFKARVQPVFLHKRKGLARCYACHAQGTPFRLQPLSPNATDWNDDESRKNFEAVLREVVPGNPDASRLLLMPLARDAGGIRFHPGGKHWTSKNDPEWQTIAAWIRAAR